MMKAPKVYDSVIPESCPKCGNRLLEVSEDGLDCIMCGWVRYLPADVVTELDKTKSLRLHRGSGKEAGQ